MIPNDKEDLKNAILIHIRIATLVFSASLVLLFVLIGYFVLNHLTFNIWGMMIILAIVCLFFSFIFCGKGLSKIRDCVAKGDYSLNNKHWYFRVQTELNLVAILLFLNVLLH